MAISIALSESHFKKILETSQDNHAAKIICQLSEPFKIVTVTFEFL